MPKVITSARFHNRFPSSLCAHVTTNIANDNNFLAASFPGALVLQQPELDAVPGAMVIVPQPASLLHDAVARDHKTYRVIHTTIVWSFFVLV